MQDTGFFRAAFRGFNKQDVFAYLEKKEEQHAQQAAQLEQQAQQAAQQAEQLRQQASEWEQQQRQAAEAASVALAEAEHLRAENAALTERLQQTAAQLEQVRQQLAASEERKQQLAKTNAVLTAVVGEKASFSRRVEAAGGRFMEQSLQFGKESLEQLQQTMDTLQRQVQAQAERAEQLQQWLGQQTADLDITDTQAEAPSAPVQNGEQSFFRAAALRRQA